MSGQRSDWRERLRANPSRMEQEIAFKLQDDMIQYQTQVEIPITTADLYFPLESRPLLVFVDGRVHHGTAQMAKDEELRTLLRKRRYRILELYYNNYSDKTRDQTFQETLNSLGIEWRRRVLMRLICRLGVTSRDLVDAERDLSGKCGRNSAAALTNSNQTRCRVKPDSKRTVTRVTISGASSSPSHVKALTSDSDFRHST